MRKFLHFGMPILVKLPDMMHIEGMKLWVSDPAKSPNHIERVFFDAESPMPALMKESAHIAYAVEDIEKALAGAEILVPITTLPDGTKLAFIVEEGVPVELIQPKA